MKILDKIYRKRLDRIREELDTYLASNFYIPVNEQKDSWAGEIPQKEASSYVMGKFLNIMKLNEDEDFFEDDEYAEGVGLPKFSKKGLKCKELDVILEQKKESFSEMLLRIIDEKGLKDSDVYKRANIDRRLFSRLRSDVNYTPSKKTAIAFCLALQMELEEARALLATAGYALSPSSRFDLIIMYLIENCEYNIHFVNLVLDDYGEGTLSK